MIHDFACAAKGAGASRIAIDEAVGLAKAGIEVTFFAAVGPVDESLLEAGVEVICLGQDDILRGGSRLASAIQGIWNSAAVDALGQAIENRRGTDLILHLHTWSKALSPSVLRLLGLHSHNVLYHLHEYFIACPNGGFFDYRQGRICSLEPMSFRCVARDCDSRSYLHKLWRVGRQLIVHHVAGYPRTRANFVVLSAMQQQVLAKHVAAGSRMFRLANPINVSKKALKPRTNNAKYLYVGRLSPEKGVRLLGGAFGDGGRRLVVVGDGDERTELEARLPHAEFLGWQSRDKVQALMTEARALIFPSAWYEGMPTVVSEALAAGLPVVCSDASSATELVHDGVNGRVFRSGDMSSLGDALATFEDIDAINGMSRNAHTRYWSDAPTLDKHIDGLMEVYRMISEERDRDAAPAAA